MAYYKCGSVYVTDNSDVRISSASGSVANFNTSLALPIKSLEIDVNAKQDLHGQSSPYPAGGSAQIWDEKWEVGIWNSSGQKSDSQNAIRCKNYIKINPSETYYVFANFTRYATGIILRLLDANKSFVRTVVVNSSSTKTFTADSNVEYVVWCSSSTDQITTYSNDVSINHPATDTSYHPYSNICPISGVSEVKIERTQKNLYDKSVESMVGFISTSIFSTSAPKSRSFYIPIVGGLSYTIQKMIGARFCVATSPYVPTNGEVFTNRIQNNTRSSLTITAGANDKYLWVFFYLYDTDTETESVVKDTIQIEVGSTATAYEPYHGNEYIINLGGTYYGGHFTQDKDGHRQFEVTHNYIASYNGEAINEPWISSMDTYSQGTTPTTGAQVVYPLATPYVIDLPDGEPINTFVGANNFFADTGDTEVVFKSSVNDYVSAHSGGNLLGMGGVYLGGAKSGGSEEEPDEGEDTEKVKLDETKVEVKEIGDDSNIKKLGGE